MQGTLQGTLQRSVSEGAIKCRNSGKNGRSAAEIVFSRNSSATIVSSPPTYLSSNDVCDSEPDYFNYSPGNVVKVI